jgi:hypothetical protein
MSGHLSAANLEGIDAAVHLAGENIAARRWTPEQKARIRESRVAGTRLLAETLAKLKKPPKTLACASAIGFYGDRSDQRLNEDSPPGTGFLADTCREWEAAAKPAVDRGFEGPSPYRSRACISRWRTAKCSRRFVSALQASLAGTTVHELDLLDDLVAVISNPCQTRRCADRSTLSHRTLSPITNSPRHSASAATATLFQCLRLLRVWPLARWLMGLLASTA